MADGDPTPTPAAAPAEILGGVPAAAPAAAPAAPAAAPAPATDVTYDFKFADGMTVSDELKGEFTAWAKEHKLDQKAAGESATLASKVLEQAAEKHIGEVQALYTKWSDDSKNDTEFGGEKFGENVNVANAALEKFGTPALTEMLKQSGLGVHPEMVRVFYRIGKLISQDSVAGAIASAASADKTQAQRMYGG